MPGFFGYLVYKFAAASFRISVLSFINISVVALIFLFYKELFDILFFCYDKINYVFNHMFDSNTSDLTLFVNVLKSVGIVKAFIEVFNLFAPVITSLILMIFSKFAINFTIHLRNTLISYFIARID